LDYGFLELALWAAGGKKKKFQEGISPSGGRKKKKIMYENKLYGYFGQSDVRILRHFPTKKAIFWSVCWSTYTFFF
jgi:hypothetical protein